MPPLDRRPVPYLLAIALASNVGSTATITGNPQNMLIGSPSGITYLKFRIELAPVALVAGAERAGLTRALLGPVSAWNLHRLGVGVPVTLATLAFGTIWVWMTH